jgi:hypothetical protein
MERSTTGKGSKSKVVWNDAFDGRELDPTRWDFEFGNKFFDVMSGQGILAEHQRFVDYYCKAVRA